MIDIVTFGVSGILTIIAILISTVLFVLTIIFRIIRAIKKKFRKNIYYTIDSDNIICDYRFLCNK